MATKIYQAFLALKSCLHVYEICYLPKSVGSKASGLDSNADSSFVSECDVGAIALAGYETGKVSVAIVELVGSTEVVGIRVGVDGTFRVDVSIGSVGIGGGVVVVGERVVVGECNVADEGIVSG